MGNNGSLLPETSSSNPVALRPWWARHRWRDVGPPEGPLTTSAIDEQLALQVVAYAQSNPSFARELSSSSQRQMHGHGLGSLLSAESLLGRFKGQPLENIKVKVDEAPSWERWRRESDAKLRKEKKTRELKREARNVMIKRGLRLPPGWDNSEDFISSDMEHDTEVDELESALIAHEKAQVDRFKRLARKGAFRANVIAKGCKVPTSWIYLKDESSGQQNEPNRLVWMLPKF